jgi:hypothetical protein
MFTRSKKQIEINKRNNYVSVSNFRNTINEDQIVDYLDLLNYKGKEIDITTLNVINKSNNYNKNNKRKSSFDYIINNGNEFEKEIIKNIKMKMKKSNDNKKFVDMTDNNDKTIKYEMTKNMLLFKKPMIIFGAILYDDVREIFGYPDIIANGEFIKKYFCNNNKYDEDDNEDSDNDNNNDNKYKKRKLDNNNAKNITNNKNYGNFIMDNNIDNKTYYIIDIKSSSLDLISEGRKLGGSKDYNYYKFQVYSYNTCMNKIFENNGKTNNSNVGFLLGRKYKALVNKKDKYFTCFENLAIIKFDEDFSKECDNICKVGKKWIIEDLRKNYFNFNVNPINRDELYPNMKNKFDGTFGTIKKAIAEKNKEITLLYYCNVDKRKCCHKQDIKRLDDERLNSDILGFKNKSQETIINDMLKLERSSKIIKLNKKENNFMDWQDKNEYEFFVDFETYSKSNFDKADEDIIYMIGSYYNEEFKCFIINNNYNIKNYIKKRNKENIKNGISELNCNDINYVLCYDEHDLINKFTDYIYSKNINNMNNEIFKNVVRLIHWSNFEKRVFESKINKYYLNNKFKLNWYDLLEVFKFKDSPIIIKGCRSFKLKEITNKLNEHKLINIKWPDLEDGLLSSFMAKDIYEHNDNKNKNNFIIDITEYNYIDCKSLDYILNFIRNYNE